MMFWQKKTSPGRLPASSVCWNLVRLLDSVFRRSDGRNTLLTDVIMPESGGKELARAFRERYPSAGVIFMSGYTEEVIARHGLLPAKIAFLQKPLIPDRVVTRIREVLDSLSSADRNRPSFPPAS